MKTALTALALLPMVSAIDCVQTAITGDFPDRTLELGPAGCDTIPNDAFMAQTDFDLVEIPSTVTHIKQNAFRGTALREVVIPDSVIEIEGYTFMMTNGGSLTSVVIGDGVTHIGAYAFWNNPNLNSLTLGNSISGFGDPPPHQGTPNTFEVFKLTGLKGVEVFIPASYPEQPPYTNLKAQSFDAAPNDPILSEAPPPPPAGGGDGDGGGEACDGISDATEYQQAGCCNC